MPRLNPAAFDSFLAGNIGQDMLWRPSTVCPCYNPGSGQANPKCPVCGGIGWQWAAPIAAKAGMTQQGNIKKYGPMGMYEMGDATLTIPQASAMYDAGAYDRITLLNSNEKFSLKFKRGAANERIYRRVLSISRVWWLVGDTPVDGGTDGITVAANGVITFGGANPPPVGVQYSITGIANDEYFIWDNQSSDRGEHFGARLPKKLIARRFDLFGRSTQGLV